MLQQDDSKKGLKCPVCGNLIQISVADLLFSQKIVCPKCRLNISIDRNESKKAMEILKKVNDAQSNLDKASKFGK